MIIVFVLFYFFLKLRLRLSIACGTANVESHRYLEKSTTATTLVLPSRYRMMVMSFSW